MDLEDKYYIFLIRNFRNGELKTAVQKFPQLLHKELVDDENPKGTLLHWASYYNNEEVAKFLIAHGAPLDARGNGIWKDKTPEDVARYYHSAQLANDMSDIYRHMIVHKWPSSFSLLSKNTQVIVAEIYSANFLSSAMQLPLEVIEVIVKKMLLQKYYKHNSD